jgi:hypothetical protein
LKAGGSSDPAAQTALNTKAILEETKKNGRALERTNDALREGAISFDVRDV